MKPECRAIASDLLELDDRAVKAYLVAKHRRYSEVSPSVYDIVQQLDAIQNRPPESRSMSDKEIDQFKAEVKEAVRLLYDMRRSGDYFKIMEQIMNFAHREAADRACRCEHG